MRDAVSSSSPLDPLGNGGIGVTEGISNHTGSTFEAGLGHTDLTQTHNSMVQTHLPVTENPVAASSYTDAMATAVPQRALGAPIQLGATEQTQPAGKLNGS
ncbi:uncharacterized protein si:ch211-80h18.1 [Electrophorus electricus]|uniref:uncharacterized protein si:ch211-80h18.1 n=1 Tax=Electrophorus electricus TaxID=8005 RepID=UPI0015D01E44|nr:uncharacterized protein si:ch211-80h18.1 [Electrophorus electricus]